MATPQYMRTTYMRYMRGKASRLFKHALRGQSEPESFSGTWVPGYPRGVSCQFDGSSQSLSPSGGRTGEGVGRGGGV